MRLSLILLCFASIMMFQGCGGSSQETNAKRSAQAQASSFQLGDVVAVPRSSVTPQNGWWWNPAEGGRGFAIEKQGNQIFLAGFLYDASGNAVWYVSTLTEQSGGAYTGQLLQYAGGQTLVGSYKAPTGNSTVAAITLNFSSATDASLLVEPTNGDSAKTISLQRFPISSPAFATANSSFESGWWWNEAQGGRGFFVEVQGSQAFIAGFMYEANGAPVWYANSATLQNSQSVSTVLQQYSGGQTLTGSYTPAATSNANVGTITFSFSGNNTGNLTLPNGTAISVKRFIFNSSATTTTTLGTTTTTSSTPTTTAGSAYAGTYTVSAEGVSVTFKVNASGQITTCSSGSILQCNGSVSSNGSFQVSGNDGQNPVDITATLNGVINLSTGAVSGTYTGNSVYEGSFSGSFTGTRDIGELTNGTPTYSSYSLAGTWVGTWKWTGRSPLNPACTYVDGGAISITLTQSKPIPNGAIATGIIGGSTNYANGVQFRTTSTCELTNTIQETGGSITGEAGAVGATTGALYFTNMGIGAMTFTASLQWDGTKIYGTLGRKGAPGSQSGELTLFKQ
ncbi:MAG: hypothetical protein HYS18_03895 [Burkholderiales bacterium]|nr:hypothetical protein [Burkholderiales bacterium]